MFFFPLFPGVIRTTQWTLDRDEDDSQHLLEVCLINMSAIHLQKSVLVFNNTACQAVKPY